MHYLKATMRTPPLVRFARPVRGEEPAALGSYDPALGLRVFESPHGPIPVTSRVPYASTVTKTDHAKESDDRAALLASMTKTESKERDDVDDQRDDATAALEVSGQQAWLALVTKTLNMRERDDEPDR